MNNDLTFFTNEPHATLLDRFKSTLKDVQYFDVLVGYFRTSGFHLLHEALVDIEKIRILVGLSVDRQAYEIIEVAAQQMTLQFEATKVAKEQFSKTVASEMEDAPDEYITELSIRKFIEFIQQGKLQIKVHPSHNIHGNAIQQKKDRDLRRKAHSLGYKIITITARELEDEATLAIKFEDIEFYLKDGDD